MMHNFTYISKRDKRVKEAYREIIMLINEIHKEVKEFIFQTEVVGSYKRNMITYDKKSNIGFDFDFNIILNENALDYKPKMIKERLIQAFNKKANKYGFDTVENSTRVITLKKIDRKKSKIIYSCDFAIVYDYIDENDFECQEYIRFNKKSNTYQWCEQSEGFFMLPEKIEWLKNNDNPEEIWQELRTLYIEKKNKNDNPDIHSRQILAIVVHEMCQIYGYYSE